MHAARTTTSIPPAIMPSAIFIACGAWPPWLLMRTVRMFREAMAELKVSTIA